MTKITDMQEKYRQKRKGQRTGEKQRVHRFNFSFYNLVGVLKLRNSSIASADAETDKSKIMGKLLAVSLRCDENGRWPAGECKCVQRVMQLRMQTEFVLLRSIGTGR